MTALRTSQVDILQRVNPQHVPIIERAKGVTLETAPERMPLVCFMNMRKPPFDDMRIRKAIGGYGMNRREIADTVFQGRATPTVSSLSPGVQDYLDLNEMYPYDPDKARALLQEAGHDASNPVEFDLILNNDAPFFADAATLLKSQMEKIGVKMNLIMMDKPAWLDRFLNKSDFQMAMEDFGALVDINQRSLGFFREARANYGGINSPELEDLTLQWRREADPAKRREIARAMQRLLAKDMLWCKYHGIALFPGLPGLCQGLPLHEPALCVWETTWLDKA
jgi:peptide/nickel transport system substrate-binding protein